MQNMERGDCCLRSFQYALAFDMMLDLCQSLKLISVADILFMIFLYPYYKSTIRVLYYKMVPLINKCLYYKKTYLNFLLYFFLEIAFLTGCSEEPKCSLNFNEVVQHVIDEEHNLDLFASVCSTVWYRRDQIRPKHSVYLISQMLLQASQALQDFLHAFPPAQPSVTSPRVRWIPPPASSLKINFDGALFEDINAAGLGVVVRDHQGLVLASWAENVRLTPTSDDVEAMAAAKAITLA